MVYVTRRLHKFAPFVRQVTVSRTNKYYDESALSACAVL
jgi:hypothetical protein